MNILGLTLGTHNSGATLLKQGQLIASVEEERLNREKYSWKFPVRSIATVLHEGKIGAEDLNAVGYGWRPWLHVGSKFLHALSLFPQTGNFLLNQARTNLSIRRMRGQVRSHLRLKSSCEVVPVEHHIAHAASAFYVSPFSEAAILTLDGHGEWSTTLFAHGEGTKIEKIGEILWPHSLGQFYHSFAEHLGFPDHGDEYKVMGLAPYGRPRYVDKVRRLLMCENGSFRINRKFVRYYMHNTLDGVSFFTDRFVGEFGERRREGEEVKDHHADLASSVQQVLNEVALKLVAKLYEACPSENLCLAGGVALNCVMNQVIREEGPYKRIFVQPASHDGGLSIGSAFFLLHHLFGEPRSFVMEHPYYGPGYSDGEIERELEICRIPYRKLKNCAGESSRLLSEGKIIGWFQGRMELGPRALGARSILSAAKPKEMKEVVNARIKFREEFRPFAPSVLEERAGEYFETEDPNPFMLFTARVRPEKMDQIPAVTHVDGTARIQTVNRKTNPLYWELISEYSKLAGVPMVLNTSFNVKGEPIVCTPTDAIRCFYSTGLDHLVIGNFLVSK